MNIDLNFIRNPLLLGLSFGILFFINPVYSQQSNYVEPGSLRLSHTIALVGVMNKLNDGWVSTPTNDGRGKDFSVDGDSERAWKSEWGSSLLTEAATRVTPDIYGRFLFELQSDYADRLWRPINVNHDGDLDDEDLIVHEAEGEIIKDTWDFRIFSGVPQTDWFAKGDLFRLYPEAIGERDYLGSSSFFGIYPQNWKQDQYQNISGRRVPRGVVGGVQLFGTEAAIAYGDELGWGIEDGVYARWSVPVAESRFTAVVKDEGVPYSFFEEDERKQAFTLNWDKAFESGSSIQTGFIYQPFRSGDPYDVVREAGPGQGISGSSFNIEQRTSQNEDGLGARLRMQHYGLLLDRLWILWVDMEYLGILAGNKEEADIGIETEFLSVFRGSLEYTYRRPIEAAIPLLFEGTPQNVGAIVANPRGPESPFTVDQTNREAVFLLGTLQYDPTPGNNFFQFDPRALAMWNVNPEEDADLAMAVQYKMSDFRGTTDRQFYYDSTGKVVWESAGQTGALATKHPLHEFRLLSRNRVGESIWTAGLAGGQMPAVLGTAYSLDPSNPGKGITEYFSLEGRIDRWPFSYWGHYGSGVWGPEENIHPNFGLSIDRLWGVGVSYNITVNTTWDINYLASRQDDNLFVAPDLGSFNEIRTVFSHRFGFLFQFQGPSRRGFQAR